MLRFRRWAVIRARRRVGVALEISLVDKRNLGSRVSSDH
jgi:hypothetical protein